MNYYVYQAKTSLNKDATPVMQRFFSDENINLIQMNLIREVKKHLHQKIGKQSCDEIYVLMKYIYTNYARQTLTNVTDEVTYLNKLVLNELVPMVISNVKQYLQYIKDINTLPTPLEYGKHTSVKGTNALEFNSY